MTTFRVLLAFLLSAGVLNAAEAHPPCTSVQSAVFSHVAGLNTESGGHVLVHIKGYTPPAPLSQFNKTLFGDESEYEAAWNALSEYSPTCPTTNVVNKEAAKDIDFTPGTSSVQCTAASHTGKCTQMNDVVTHHATFVFRTVANGGGTKWILVTAYPRE